MEIRYTQGKKEQPVSVMKVEAMEGEKCLSKIGAVTTRPTRYRSQWISTMTVGGVGTDPEYRRGGYVRKMLEDLFRISEERDWVVSLLHPFSFSYYRKFGYEKVGDHLILEFPIQKLEHFPRVNDFVKLEGGDRVPDCVKVFEKFSMGRNLMFRRFGGEHLPTEPDWKKKRVLSALPQRGARGLRGVPTGAGAGGESRLRQDASRERICFYGRGSPAGHLRLFADV